MTAASGPTGNLAGRPSVCQSQLQNGTATKASKDNKKVAVLKKGCCKEKEDLVTRPSAIDAKITMDQIKKGKAEGKKWKIRFRAYFQEKLFKWGCCMHKNEGKFIFVAILTLASVFVGIKNCQFHHKVEDLWITMGGRLETEILYTAKNLKETSTSTHQLLIQTPKAPGEDILTSAALQDHLTVLKAATEVTVEVDELPWKLIDLCYAPAMPQFENHLTEQIFDRIRPCAVITPLDCFWEGSKLLGPDDPIPIGALDMLPNWTHLNPSGLLEKIKNTNVTFNFENLEKFMKRAGITTGYLEKPCLNPKDENCPETAPNKASQKVPDIGAELTGGCYGFAVNHMHWPEELLVGGATRNPKGHILKAKALQTVVQLMSEKELFDYFKDHVKVRTREWSLDQARKILETWQRNFNEEVKRQLKGNTTSKEYNFYGFSTSSLNDILKEYTNVSFVFIGISRAVILLYTVIVLYNRKDPIRSQSAIALAGVVLVYAAEMSGLGAVAVLGKPFNVVTVQALPFLNIVLAVSDIFLLTHSYREISMINVPPSEQTGVILKRIGPQVFLTRLCSCAVFFCSWLIPIPALRAFALNAGILNLYGLVATIVIFPAFISLDLKRRRYSRLDIFCCCVSEIEKGRTFHTKHSCSGKAKQTVTRAMPPDRRETCTQILSSEDDMNESWVGGNVIGDSEESTEADTLTQCSKDDCLSFSMAYWVKNYYAPFITQCWVKVVAITLLGLILSACLWQARTVKDGLELAGIVPQNSDEHAFLVTQAKNFGFYNMFAVTGEFDYPGKQEELRQYYEKISRVKNVIKPSSHSQSDFWLINFQNWLKDLQAVLEKEKEQKTITSEGWFKNASDEGILAYKLIVQTGNSSNLIDKSRVNTAKLCDKNIINPEGFYNYLSAWATNDALAYGASQANIVPAPKEWIFNNDYELQIPKSDPITYAQIPFYLHKLTDTEKITEMIYSIRQICEEFVRAEIPNFPSGIPFLFWEQYMDLRTCLAYALLAALLAITIIISVLLMNFWAVVLVQFFLAGNVIQLLGIMGFFDIHLSAVSAVLLVVSIGISVPFYVHLCLGFVTSIGNRNRRISLALEHTFPPVMHGAVTALLSVVILAFSEFEFVVHYFFLILFTAVIVGMLNGLFYFPILLSIIGPSPEIIPNDQTDRISTPTPPASPIVRRLKAPAPPRRPHKNDTARIHNDHSPSLTTITEEPNSWHSNQESCNIIVQPEIKVETTSTTCSNQNCSGSDRNGSSHMSDVPPMSHITTKVTATANIKVELHTSGMDRRNKCRHGGSSRKSTRFSTNVNSTESSSSSSE